MRYSRRVWILEGPDGGGKTTLAKYLVSQYNARYVHCGPFPGVAARSLPRLYLEAILPAVQGYQDVVLDRSWLSELAYGPAFRGGSRVDLVDLRMLDRVAARCQTVVAACLPPVKTCLEAYRARKGQEYLPTEDLLRLVYEAYDYRLASWTTLPVVRYDYTAVPTRLGVQMLLRGMTTPLPADTLAAGCADAPVLLVGEAAGPVKSVDQLTRWPFVSFSNAGCARWLTRELELLEVSERDLLWFNADDPELTTLLPALLAGRLCHVVGFGAVAQRRLRELGVPHHVVAHPQWLKRFGARSTSPGHAARKAFGDLMTSLNLRRRGTQ